MNLLLFNLKTDADDSILGFTTAWINALAVRCERITVITMAAGRVEVEKNVEVISVGKERGYSEPRRALEFYRLLSRALRCHKYDACFAHMMPLFAVMAWPQLAARRVPITLWYAHGHVSPLLRLAVFLVDRVVSATPRGFRVNTPKLTLIGHGIDTDQFKPGIVRRGDEIVVVTVGRISPVKRLELLIEATSLLPNTLRSRVSVKIAGKPLAKSDAAYLCELKQTAQRLGMQGRIAFVGEIRFKDINSLYSDADVFVNCSDTDSADKAVLEAMSAGVPIVTSNAAFAEILDVSTIDLWVAKDARAIADRLTRLLALSPEERRNLGLKLREIVVRDHSLPALADKLVGILSKGTEARRTH